MKQTKNSWLQQNLKSRPLYRKATTVAVRLSYLIYYRHVKLKPGFRCAIYSYIITRDRVFYFCHVFSIVVIKY